jgi:hypothetical protein
MDIENTTATGSTLATISLKLRFSGFTSPIILMQKKEHTKHVSWWTSIREIGNRKPLR